MGSTFDWKRDLVTVNGNAVVRKAPHVRLIVLCAFAVGCGPRWTKPDFSERQWNTDDHACGREAAELFPSVFRPYTIYEAPRTGRANCTKIGDFVSCTTTEKPAQHVQGKTDLNKGNRKDAFERCIRARGYMRPSEMKNLPGVADENTPLIRMYRMPDGSRRFTISGESEGTLIGVFRSHAEALAAIKRGGSEAQQDSGR